ncbi:MAG: hypothetical protein GF311_27955 [Candidatus Lokiarchaeota archaeon]|nr:hypothetical protein [Candidatus Lokiarchaeota archaeon]
MRGARDVRPREGHIRYRGHASCPQRAAHRIPTGGMGSAHHRQVFSWMGVRHVPEPGQPFRSRTRPAQSRCGEGRGAPGGNHRLTVPPAHL